MKNYLLAFLYSIGFISFGSAQTDTVDKLNYVTLDIVSPITSYAPRYEIGFYRHLDDRWIVGAEVGFGNYATTINFAKEGNWIEKDYKSFSIAPEIKYILNPKRRTRKFVSAEIFYIYHSDKLSNRNYRNSNSERNYSFETADYERHRFGLNFNYGMIINFSESVGIIPKLGVGFKTRNVDFTNQKNLKYLPDYEESDVVHFTPTSHLNTEGLVTGFNFNFEIQFFYKF